MRHHCGHCSSAGSVPPVVAVGFTGLGVFGTPDDASCLAAVSAAAVRRAATTAAFLRCPGLGGQSLRFDAFCLGGGLRTRFTSLLRHRRREQRRHRSRQRPYRAPPPHCPPLPKTRQLPTPHAPHRRKAHHLTDLRPQEPLKPSMELTIDYLPEVLQRQLQITDIRRQILGAWAFASAPSVSDCGISIAFRTSGLSTPFRPWSHAL
jgi:hypothetical protein